MPIEEAERGVGLRLLAARGGKGAHLRRKHNRRLSDKALAAKLAENDLIDQAALDALLGRCPEDGMLADAIVESGVMGDWELGRWASRFFARPFLPVELCAPNPKASLGLDMGALFRHRVVPLWRGPAGIVVSMPGTSSEAALDALAKQAGCPVYAVVGSVRGNRRWLEESLPPALLPGEDGKEEERWSLLFDVGDARARETFGD